ncbi:MAG: lipase [Microbacterium sp.]|nr:lipase [Microbacterium sp.]
MTVAIPRPPFDAELEPALDAVAQMLPTLTPEMIPALRASTAEMLSQGLDEQIAAAGVTVRDVTIPGYEGAEITATIIARADHAGHRPGIVHLHGGGMVMGDQMTGVDTFLSAVVRHDAVLVSIDYRLAPEFPDPYPVEDCYAGLVWTAEHADELGIDAERLLVGGTSAGGGLTAGTALLARDRRGPALAGQILLCPMLDDRDATVSTTQIDGVGVWNREANVTGWSALLGDRKGGDDVSIYAAPARATDLSGLPTTYIDCGSAEVFRDEDVAYATALWAAGVQAELHVWAGGFHGFDTMAPQAAVSQAAIAARESWIDRVLGA